jgi:hypothetical protein
MSAVHRVNVLQGSIDQLERVSALLAAEIHRAAGNSSEPAVAKRLSKEALLGISVLLPKLRAVRNFSALVDPESPVSPEGRAADAGEGVDDWK